MCDVRTGHLGRGSFGVLTGVGPERKTVDKDLQVEGRRYSCRRREVQVYNGNDSLPKWQRMDGKDRGL